MNVIYFNSNQCNFLFALNIKEIEHTIRVRVVETCNCCILNINTRRSYTYAEILQYLHTQMADGRKRHRMMPTFISNTIEHQNIQNRSVSYVQNIEAYFEKHILYSSQYTLWKHVI